MFLLIINNIPITVTTDEERFVVWGIPVGKVLKFGWDLHQPKCPGACSGADSVVKVRAGNKDFPQEEEVDSSLRSE